MIKNLYLSTVSLFLGVLFFASCGGGSSRFTVSVEGLADDSLMCSYVTLDIIENRSHIPVYIVGGERDEDNVITFDIDLPGGDQLYKVFLTPQSSRGDGPNQDMEFFLLPGEKVHIDARYDAKLKSVDYTIEGSAVQQEWQEYNKQFKQLQLQAYMGDLLITILPGESLTKDSVLLQIQQIRQGIDAMKAEYIGDNPSAPLSGYCLTTISDVHIADSLYQLLDDDVKNGQFKGWLKLQNEMIADMFVAEKGRVELVVETSSSVDSLSK